jgi:hypothetical protein
MKNYVGECKGNDGGGCFLDSCGHDCGCFTVEQTPEIPQLGEGVEMEVSNALIPWQKRKIIAKRHDGLFIDDNGILWPHSRPIQEVKKYTKEELVKILGHDFEII